MTIIHSGKITQLEISPDSQWDIGLDKFMDWEPHSNGQLFITHVDPNPKTYPSPPQPELDTNLYGEYKAIDSLQLGFGKKYPNKTPMQLLSIDPQYIVWCRENTSRVFCSDELYDAAKRICEGKKGLMR